jgi:hypothetical protein
MSVAAKATEDDNNTPAIAAPLNVLDNPFNMVLTFLLGMSVQGAEVPRRVAHRFVGVKPALA